MNEKREKLFSKIETLVGHSARELKLIERALEYAKRLHPEAVAFAAKVAQEDPARYRVFEGLALAGLTVAEQGLNKLEDSSTLMGNFIGVVGKQIADDIPVTIGEWLRKQPKEFTAIAVPITDQNIATVGRSFNTILKDTFKRIVQRFNLYQVFQKDGFLIGPGWELGASLLVIDEQDYTKLMEWWRSTESDKTLRDRFFKIMPAINNTGELYAFLQHDNLTDYVNFVYEARKFRGLLSDEEWAETGGKVLAEARQTATELDKQSREIEKELVGEYKGVKPPYYVRSLLGLVGTIMTIIGLGLFWVSRNAVSHPAGAGNTIAPFEWMQNGTSIVPATPHLNTGALGWGILGIILILNAIIWPFFGRLVNMISPETSRKDREIKAKWAQTSAREV